MSATPIAVFTYNRPAHTRRLLDSLENCYRVHECRIFIFSDAARVPEHRADVEETRKLVRDWAHQHGATLEEREENWGLAKSIVDGVSRLCRTHGRVIAIEDDLVLHRAFIDFMLCALDRYENAENVAQISGYMFPVENAPKPDGFFLPFMSTWGWATWQRVWQDVNWMADGARVALQNRSTRKQFDLDGAYPYAEMLFDRLGGKNQSWGIIFNWHLFSKNFLAFYPWRSLVLNTGHDGSGVHMTRPLTGFNLKDFDSSSPRSFDASSWPSNASVDAGAYHRIRRFLINTNRGSGFVGEVIARLFRHGWGYEKSV